MKSYGTIFSLYEVLIKHIIDNRIGFSDQHLYMQHNYTTNQIIKYLYCELPALEHLETEHAIAHNPEWASTYKKLKSALSVLPRFQFFPKNSVVKSILQYSATV